MSQLAQQFNSLGRGQLGGQINDPPAPLESFTQVIDGSISELEEVESKVNEVINRLFNFPRGLQQDGSKSPTPPSVSERALDIRSRAIRINQALEALLEKL